MFPIYMGPTHFDTDWYLRYLQVATACLSPLRVPIRISAHVEANYWLPSTSWAIKFLRPQPSVTEAARSFVLTRGSQVWQLGV